MEFRHKQLANGLNIVGEINKAAKSAAVGFFVKTGSRDETEQINGVSHFLEHMLFKGTEKLNPFEVNLAFDRTGAQFNAFTNEENTVFYAAILPEYIVEITKLWSELMRPALRNEDFDIEKNVIKEEIGMYKDMPSYDVIDRCRTLYFDGHPCGNSVLGSVESIDNLTAAQMRQYFETRYAPNNIALACAGNYDFEQICSVAEELCGSWQSRDVAREIKGYSGNSRKERIEKENITREHICLMSPGVSAQDNARFAASLLATIIGDDVGSRYFWELVDKALAESASMQFSAMDGTGTFYTYIRCSRQNVTKVLDIINGIFNSLSKEGVTEDELTKAKNKVLSSLVIKNELPMGRLIELGFNWVYLREYLTIESQIRAIEEVTIEDIKSLIENLKPGNFTQLSLGPQIRDS
ncbi:MAG: pitrilysin family protein [Sedimentisphaerales bacterium]